MSKNFDVISIGSSSVDVLIRLRKGEMKEEHHNMFYHLGEKLPVEDLYVSTGGGATNTSVAFSRLGLKAGCVTAVGEDENGKIVLRNLKEEGVEFLGKIKNGRTGYSIILPGKNDRTIMVYSGVNNELRFNDIEENIKNIQTKWLYISSLRENGFRTIDRVSKILRERGTRMAMNMSSYLARLGARKLRNVLSRLDLLILNKEEVLALAGEKNVRDSLDKLRGFMRGIIVVTNGQNPIHLFNSISGDIHIHHVKRVKVVDATGAGDAFSAGFLYAIMRGVRPDEAVKYGYEEAKSTLKYIGAKEKLLRKIFV